MKAYGNRVDLLNGLKDIIEKVETLDKNLFIMTRYTDCVIGKIIRAHNLNFLCECNDFVWDEVKALKHFFNIDIEIENPDDQEHLLFDVDINYVELKIYDIEQNEVLRLFTSAVCKDSEDGISINKRDWLVLAKGVYTKLSESTTV